MSRCCHFPRRRPRRGPAGSRGDCWTVGTCQPVAASTSSCPAAPGTHLPQSSSPLGSFLRMAAGRRGTRRWSPRDLHCGHSLPVSTAHAAPSAALSGPRTAHVHHLRSPAETSQTTRRTPRGAPTSSCHRCCWRRTGRRARRLLVWGAQRPAWGGAPAGPWGKSPSSPRAPCSPPAPSRHGALLPVAPLLRFSSAAGVFQRAETQTSKPSTAGSAPRATSSRFARLWHCRRWFRPLHKTPHTGSPNDRSPLSPHSGGRTPDRHTPGPGRARLGRPLLPPGTRPPPRRDPARCRERSLHFSQATVLPGSGPTLVTALCLRTLPRCGRAAACERWWGTRFSASPVGPRAPDVAT